MKTIIIKELELTNLPPRGWKKKIAESVGCCEKTVYNTLRGKIKGAKSHKILEAYKQLCGVVTKTEMKDS